MIRQLPSRPLLVRVDPATRAAALNTAQATGHSLSHLVRQATRWWSTNPTRTCPGVGERCTGKKSSAFLNVRFSEHDMNLVEKVAAEAGLSNGAVVRQAVRAWLACAPAEHTST